MGPNHSTLLPAHYLKDSSQGPVPQTSAKCLSHYTVHVHKKGSVALHPTRQMDQKLIYIGAMYAYTYIMAQCLSPCPNKVAEDGKGWLTAANTPLQSRTDRHTYIGAILVFGHLLKRGYSTQAELVWCYWTIGEAHHCTWLHLGHTKQTKRGKQDMATCP